MAEIKKYTVTEPFVELKCGLGEAPFWEETTNTLRFVDIVKQRIHEVNLDKGPSSHRELAHLDISVGTTADIEGNDKDFAFSGKHGYGIINRQTMKYKYIKKYWDGEANAETKAKERRGNDGGVDCRGRYWAGIMNDPLVKDPTDEGVVFRLDADLSLHRMIEGVTIPNGISWSLDNKTMYFSDSPKKDVLAYDYDVETGDISNKRVFFHVEGEDGVPDGHALDEEGHMWQCIFGEGRVLRISPEGKVVAEISLPTRCVSCPTFAGEDLYITSAEEEEPDKFPDSVKYGGSLFKCHVGVGGQKLHKFRYTGDTV